MVVAKLYGREFEIDTSWDYYFAQPAEEGISFGEIDDMPGFIEEGFADKPEEYTSRAMSSIVNTNYQIIMGADSGSLDIPGELYRGLENTNKVLMTIMKECDILPGEPTLNRNYADAA